MDDAQGVAVRHRLQQLAQHAPRLGLREAALLHDRVEELAAAQELHHEVGALRRAHHLVQPHDVRMVRCLEHCHLDAQRLQRLEILVGFDDLDGKLRAGGVRAGQDLREAAGAQRAAERVAGGRYAGAVTVVDHPGS